MVDWTFLLEKSYLSIRFWLDIYIYIYIICVCLYIYIYKKLYIKLILIYVRLMDVTVMFAAIVGLFCCTWMTWGNSNLGCAWILGQPTRGTQKPFRSVGSFFRSGASRQVVQRWTGSSCLGWSERYMGRARVCHEGGWFEGRNWRNGDGCFKGMKVAICARIHDGDEFTGDKTMAYNCRIFQTTKCDQDQ